jgi:hypothetical protein
MSLVVIGRGMKVEELAITCPDPDHPLHDHPHTFTPCPAIYNYSTHHHPATMGTPADRKKMADRWRRATRALKREDQEYGNRLARILEDYPWNMSNRFEDPLEEAALVLCIGILKELEREDAPPPSE